MDAPALALDIAQDVAPHVVKLSSTAKGKIQVEIRAVGATPQDAADAALETLTYVKQKLGADFAQG